MIHDFSNHTTTQLVVLADCLKGTLQNVACEAIHDNVSDTLNQVLTEIKRRANG
jgi:hypothetical protein